MLRKFWFFGALSLVALMVLGLGSMASPADPLNFCVGGVDAQDNPCAAQDATISALEVVALQATLDTVDHAATVEALKDDSGRADAEETIAALTVTVGVQQRYLYTQAARLSTLEAQASNVPVIVVTSELRAIPTLPPQMLPTRRALPGTWTPTPANAEGGNDRAVPDDGCLYYFVQSGDTCANIAAMLGIAIEDLLAANPEINPNCSNLQIGQALFIPTTACPSPDGEDEGATPLPVVDIIAVQNPDDISGEALVIENQGPTAVVLDGWQIIDQEGIIRYIFPDRVLFSQGLITLYTRSGQDSPIALFMDRESAIWQRGDRIELWDAEGRMVTVFFVEN